MGNRIREIRRDRGFSQDKLGRLIGHDKMYVSRLECQKRRFNVDVLYRLARALSCHPAELLDDSVALKPDEAEIIHRFRDLSERDRTATRFFVNSLRNAAAQSGYPGLEDVQPPSHGLHDGDGQHVYRGEGKAKNRDNPPDANC